jgi:hypothetical protein
MGIIIFYWIYLKFIATSHTWHHDTILCALKMNLLTTSLTPFPLLTYMDMKTNINFIFYQYFCNYFSNTISKPPPLNWEWKFYKMK